MFAITRPLRQLHSFGGRREVQPLRLIGAAKEPEQQRAVRRLWGGGGRGAFSLD